MENPNKLSRSQIEDIAREAFSKVKKSQSIKLAIENYERYLSHVRATGRLMEGISKRTCASCKSEYYGMHNLCDICSAVYVKDFREEL